VTSAYSNQPTLGLHSRHSNRELQSIQWGSMVLGRREPGRGRAIGWDGRIPARSPDFDGPAWGVARVCSEGIRPTLAGSVLDGVLPRIAVLGTDGPGSSPRPGRRRRPVGVRFEELHEKCFQADGEERPLLVFTVGTGGSQDHP
jgi:hypothetical protein